MTENPSRTLALVKATRHFSALNSFTLGGGGGQVSNSEGRCVGVGPVSCVKHKQSQCSNIRCKGERPT